MGAIYEMIMKIFHLIYTKVAPEYSPWKKADFHTVFYPIDLMGKEDVLEVEKKIHFPGQEKFKENKIVFYQRIKGKDYLFILYMRDLPQERDTFGRTGIFLCHGFIFSEELWRRVPNPLTLFELVKDKVFTNREDILSSPLINKQTGDTIPIETSQKRIQDLLSDLPLLKTDFEWKMTILLNRFAHIEKKPVIILKGEPEKISCLMNKLIAYVPSNLKVNLGWNPCFEGGNLVYYPLKIVGFQYEHPTGVGANAIEVDLDTLTIKETSDNYQLLLPDTAYENWLSSCRNEVSSYDQIERAYNLSLLLEESVSFSSDKVLAEKKGFARANQGKIRDVFFKRCSVLLGEPLSTHIASLLAIEEMLELIIANFPPAKLVNYIEDAILKNRMTQETVKVPISDSFKKVGNYRLTLIDMVWSGKALSFSDLAKLENKDRLEFIKYLILTKWKDEAWVLKLLTEDEKLFQDLLSSSETKKVLEEMLLKNILIKEEFNKIAELILNEVLSQEKGFSLLRGDIDLMEVLEESLKSSKLSSDQIKTLILWAQKRKLEKIELPYIKAFLYPRQGIPKEVLEDKLTRERLFKILIQHHNYQVKDFAMLGLKEDELLSIKEAIKIKKRSWPERIKGLFSKKLKNKGG